MRMTRALPLAETVFAKESLARDLLLIVSFSLLTALLTRLEIPLWPVPITGQTFAVLLAGAALGSRKGAASQALYVAYGLSGAPVFSRGGAGFQHLLGPTGGYLIGFILAAYVVGLLAERGWDRRIVTMIGAMILGNAIIYAAGLTRLSGFVPGDQLLAAGLFPFLVGDAIKIALAAIVLPGGWWLIGRSHGPQDIGGDHGNSG